MNINNRHFFKTQELTILPGSLKVESKSIFDAVEYEISFEHIHNKKIVQTSTNDNFLMLAFSLIVIGLLFMLGKNVQISSLGVGGGLVFLILALITRKKVVSIPTYNGEKIELFFNAKNKKSVLEFSDKIIEASNTFLLNKYGKIDRALPIDGQLSNINFLRDRNIITNEEFENLKDHLLGRENKGTLGFK